MTWLRSKDKVELKRKPQKKEYEHCPVTERVLRSRALDAQLLVVEQCSLIYQQETQKGKQRKK